MHRCKHTTNGPLAPRTELALEFAIIAGLRQQFTSAAAFLRSLNGYLRAFAISHPKEATGPVYARRCAAIARGLTEAPSRRAAEYQAEFIRDSIVLQAKKKGSR